jgi:predicted Kef-type K+ transport protein
MDRETWWIGALFAVGSLCFALGAAPRYVNLVGVAADGITFFVGSIFFTSAAARKYRQDKRRW